jgi:hypothetical protein
MFHKFKNAFNNVKNFLGQGYTHGKNFLGRLDNALQTGKDMYRMIEPTLYSLAPETTSKANRHLNVVSSKYDSIKHKVVQAHDTAEHHVKDISNKFKSKNIHIGL